MTLTPAGHARRAGAIRNVAALLEQWGATHTDQRATQILDAVDAAGWHPPRDLTHTAPPCGAGASRQAIDAARQALTEALNRPKEHQ